MKTVNVAAYGISTELPEGWEGRITRRPDPTSFGGPGRAEGSAGWDGEREYPLAHYANFTLPEDRGDFGSGAVDVMGEGSIFITLTEYGTESVGTALFAPQGLPRNLRPRDFSGAMLQRTLPGQAGHQSFFTAAGRPFCLYVVLGAQRQAPSLVPLVNQTLTATEIAPS